MDDKATIQMLREAVKEFIGLHDTEESFEGSCKRLHEALTATEQDVEAWEKSKRDAVLEEVIETLSNCQFITDDPRRDQRDYAMFLSTKKLCVEGVKRLKDKP